MKPFERHRKRRTLRKGFALVLSVSVAFAMLVSLAPCCQLFDGLVIPAANAAVNHGATDHEHHDHGTSDDHHSGPVDHGPCSAQHDLTGAVPDLALTGSNPQLDDADFAAVAIVPAYPQEQIKQFFSTHSPPPRAPPLYLRFVRLIE